MVTRFGAFNGHRWVGEHVRPIRTPSRYLRRTKNKGRQLSWTWCWRTLVDMAEYPHLAKAFVLLHRPLLRGQLRRALGVGRAEPVAEALTAGETRVWEERDLAGRYPWLREQQGNEKLAPWLDEIDGALT